MKNQKKERLANWIFVIVLFYFVLPWSGIITRLASSVKTQLSKPFISQELFGQKWGEVRAIFDQAKNKGKEYAALDYARGILNIHLIQADMESKYRFDPLQTTIIERWKSSYGLFQERIKEREPSYGGFSGLALTHAMAQARQEAGMSNAFEGILTKARLAKFLKWLFLFAWPFSLPLILLLYVRRCQIREISLKELVILSPLKFLGCVVFGLIGLMINFPGNDMAGFRRYLKLKNAYMREKGWGYWLNRNEEVILWQQARMPLERFDHRVQQVLVYSRIVAFLSSLLMWIFIAPFRSMAQTPKEQPAVTAKIIPELFSLSNFQLGGVVQLKTTVSGKEISWSKRVALDVKGKILSWGKFHLNYAGKTDLTKTDPTLPYASIEVVPGVSFIDKICLGRIFDPAYQGLPPHLMQTIEFLYHTGFPTDVGISVAGHSGQFTWTLARFDGDGGLLIWKDSNKTKDLAANLIWSPKSFFGSNVFKWRTVYRGGDQTPNGKRFILGTDLSLSKGKLTTEAGLVMHREGAKNLDGGWLLGFATFEKWRPLLQYDFQVGKGGRLIAGLNFLIDKVRRIQFNVEKTALGTIFRAQYQVGF